MLKNEKISNSTINPIRFVLRDEFFGSSLYDKERLKHVFLNKKETTTVLLGDFKFDGIRISDSNLEHLKGKIKGKRTNIIYSPIRIYYEITTGCNLRCKTCFNRSGKPKEDELSVSEVIKTLNGLRNDNIFDIRFTGGEPTTKDGWEYILQHAKDIGFAISMNTNAVFKDEKVINKIANIAPHQVTLSFDGLKQTHDFIRGRGSFNRAFSSLQALHEKGIELRTNTLITKQTVKEAEEMIELFKPYVKDISFFNMRLIGRATQIMKKGVTYEELKRFNEHMDDVVKKHPEIRIHYREPSTTYNAIPANNSFGLLMGRCPGGLTRFVITSEGDMHTCGYMPYIDSKNPVPGACLGNIVKENYTILNKWHKSKSLDSFRAINKQRTQVCLNCNYYETECPGVCLADEFIAKNLPSKTNPYCLKKFKMID